MTPYYLGDVVLRVKTPFFNISVENSLKLEQSTLNKLFEFQQICFIFTQRFLSVWSLKVRVMDRSSGFPHTCGIPTSSKVLKQKIPNTKKFYSQWIYNMLDVTICSEKAYTKWQMHNKCVFTHGRRDFLDEGFCGKKKWREQKCAQKIY